MEQPSNTDQLDSIVLSVIEKFKTRAKIGKQKYGTDLDRTDLSINDWVQHAQEELMDGILYLEKLKQESNKKSNIPLVKQESTLETILNSHWGC